MTTVSSEIEKGVWQEEFDFHKHHRYYLETKFGQVKVFVEAGTIVIQLFERKKKRSGTS